MTDHPDSEIISEFIGYHRMALDSDRVLRRQGQPWATEMLNDLSFDDPERCWSLTLAILSQQPNDDALMHLSAAVANLLVQRPAFIATVKRDAPGNNLVGKIMSWIEKDPQFSPELWLEIELLSDPLV